MKGKRFLLAAAVLVAVLFSSCSITVRGDVSIGYGWDDYLYSFYDTNPSIPADYIVEDNYYQSRAGHYWTDYTWTNYLTSARYVFDYYLTADYSTLGDPYGPYDSYFYIYLDSAGPAIYDPIYRGLENGAKSVDGKTAKTMAVTAPSSVVNRENLGEPTGVIEKSSNGYTIHLEYWKVE